MGVAGAALMGAGSEPQSMRPQAGPLAVIAAMHDPRPLCSGRANLSRTHSGAVSRTPDSLESWLEGGGEADRQVQKVSFDSNGDRRTVGASHSPTKGTPMALHPQIPTPRAHRYVLPHAGEQIDLIRDTNRRDNRGNVICLGAEEVQAIRAVLTPVIEAELRAQIASEILTGIPAWVIDESKAAKGSLILAGRDAVAGRQVQEVSDARATRHSRQCR